MGWSSFSQSLLLFLHPLQITFVICISPLGVTDRATTIVPDTRAEIDAGRWGHGCSTKKCSSLEQNHIPEHSFHAIHDTKQQLPRFYHTPQILGILRLGPKWTYNLYIVSYIISKSRLLHGESNTLVFLIKTRLHNNLVLIIIHNCTLLYTITINIAKETDLATEGQVSPL